MEILLNDGHLISHLVMLIGAGVVAGLLAGLFGVGGGVVLVPVLDYFLSLIGVDESIRTHVAVATSLGVIVPTSIRSFLSHKAKGAVDMVLLKKFIIAVPLGVGLGSLVATIISGHQLRLVFAVVTTLIALKLIFDKPTWRLGKDYPSNPVTYCVGGVIGLLSVLMGIGGGVMNNTFMTLYNKPIHTSVATSSGVGVLISIPGIFGMMWAGWGNSLLPQFTLGYVHWLAVLCIIPITLIVAPLGVRLAHGLSKQRLSFIFGLFLLLVAFKFIYSVYSGG